MSWSIAEWLRARKSKAPRLIIAVDEMHDLLRAQLRLSLAERCTIRLADRAYESISKAEAIGFIQAAASFWTAEVNDCDDQAWIAKAAAIKAQFPRGPYAFGVIWTPTHAFNWFCGSDKRIHCCDQPGQIVPAGTHGQINLILA